MSAKRKKMDDELASRLRARLREGDPAGGGEGLAPGEVWEMRRRMLAAIPERRRPRLLLGLASAAAAALALALGIALHREVPPPAPLPETAPMAAPAAPLAAPASPPVPAAAPALAPAPERAPATRPARAAHRSHGFRSPARRAVVASAPVDRPEPPAPPPQPLQIQFDTPGGTRVVWVLEPAKP